MFPARTYSCSSAWCTTILPTPQRTYAGRSSARLPLRQQNCQSCTAPFARGMNQSMSTATGIFLKEFVLQLRVFRTRHVVIHASHSRKGPFWLLSKRLPNFHSKSRGSWFCIKRKYKCTTALCFTDPREAHTGRLCWADPGSKLPCTRKNFRLLCYTARAAPFFRWKYPLAVPLRFRTFLPFPLHRIVNFRYMTWHSFSLTRVVLPHVLAPRFHG